METLIICITFIIINLIVIRFLKKVLIKPPPPQTLNEISQEWFMKLVELEDKHNFSNDYFKFIFHITQLSECMLFKMVKEEHEEEMRNRLKASWEDHKKEFLN